MKLKYSVVLTGAVILGLTGLISSTQAKNSKAQRNGTSIFHWFVKATMADVPPEVIDPEAEPVPTPTGRVDLKQNKQGNANNQRVKMDIGSLEANGDYQLLALLGDNTNYMHITDFTTAEDGSAKFHYKSNGKSRGKSFGKGKKKGHVKHGRYKFGMPAAMNPISNIRELAIANVETQMVLQVDLTLPDHLHYLIKRNLDNDGLHPEATGTLSLKANTRKSQFDLHAAGLPSGTNYFLVLNGHISEEADADDAGNLSLSTTMNEPIDVLALETIAIWDAGSNSVLSATLEACPTPPNGR